MRILLTSPVLFMPWAKHTAAALRQLGHTVLPFNENSLTVDRLTQRKGREWAGAFPPLLQGLDRFRENWMTRRDQRLFKAAKAFKPDLMLLLWGETFSPETLETLKAEQKVPLWTWWLDDPFRRLTPARLGTYDRFYVFDRSYLQPLKEAGVKDARFLPCACDESVYKPQTLSAQQQRRYGSDVSLVAWYYPNRGEVVQAFSDLNLKIWGREWQRTQGPSQEQIQADRFLSPEEACWVHNASKIGLNIHATQTHQAGLNARTFELLASGTFELSDAIPGIEELLTPNEEIVVYKTPAEARGLAERFLSDEASRRKIAQKGRQRVLSEHTYQHRMRQILQELN